MSSLDSIPGVKSHLNCGNLAPDNEDIDAILVANVNSGGIIETPAVNRQDKVKALNLKTLPKLSNLKKTTLYATQRLKLIDKMCKYEMDPASIVEDTEWTRFCPQTDGETDRRTDKVKSVYPTSLSVGYNYKELHLREDVKDYEEAIFVEIKLNHYDVVTYIEEGNPVREIMGNY